MHLEYEFVYLIDLCFCLNELCCMEVVIENNKNCMNSRTQIWNNILIII